jgi:hypothetical protein
MGITYQANSIVDWLQEEGRMIEDAAILRHPVVMENKEEASRADEGEEEEMEDNKTAFDYDAMDAKRQPGVDELGIWLENEDSSNLAQAGQLVDSVRAFVKDGSKDRLFEQHGLTRRGSAEGDNVGSSREVPSTGGLVEDSAESET